ncbi:MAG: hypothetical protein FWG82_01485 [Oscillospiraceae bacterium]|nr:hypothetical protein [Oscillospiraceae bacterium]
MEKKIINSLDNLTLEQTERLLDDNMEIKINSKDRNRIKKFVYEKIGSEKKRRIYIPKKIVACAAALAIIFTSLSLVGFDNAAAAIKNLFAFIPGVGIFQKADDTIYTIDSITGQIKLGNSTANIVRAVYSKGYLDVTIEVNDKKLADENHVKTDKIVRMPFYEDFSLYINGLLINFMDEEPSGAALFWSTSSAMLNFSYKTIPPTDNDIYEIAIKDFSERLSFKMIPCRSYEDIKEIGPTDIQNGISLTTDTQRIDGQLVVWCYPFRLTNHTKDMILGYGQPANGSFVENRYIETESGRLSEDHIGWSLTERFIYDISENDQSATLHIPYLSMLREEKKRLHINLPKDYSTIDSDITVENSLGTIKVVKVIREPNEYESDKDTVRIYFEFDSKDENMRLYSFGHDFGKYSSNAKKFNEKIGCLDFLEIYVDKKDSKISLKILQLYYYMFGEYVIPLDIQ